MLKITKIFSKDGSIKLHDSVMARKDIGSLKQELTVDSGVISY